MDLLDDSTVKKPRLPPSYDDRPSLGGESLPPANQYNSRSTLQKSRLDQIEEVYESSAIDQPDPNQ